MPSMTLDEILTKLAMELAEWPPQNEKIPFTKEEWLAERQRLINKPSWDDAPEWATHLCQDSSGEWFWFPKEAESLNFIWDHDCFKVDCQVSKFSSQGNIPAGHDWRTTLERRPDSQKPALSEECMNSTIDAVNHPQHYQSDTGIECIDAIRASLGKEGFIAYCRGNAQKYAWRTGKKKEHAEDLRKAAWYLERAAKEMEE